MRRIYLLLTVFLVSMLGVLFALRPAEAAFRGIWGGFADAGRAKKMG